MTHYHTDDRVKREASPKDYFIGTVIRTFGTNTLDIRMETVLGIFKNLYSEGEMYSVRIAEDLIVINPD